jgi:hypothetical protein
MFWFPKASSHLRLVRPSTLNLAVDSRMPRIQLKTNDRLFHRGPAGIRAPVLAGRCDFAREFARCGCNWRCILWVGVRQLRLVWWRLSRPCAIRCKVRSSSLRSRKFVEKWGGPPGPRTTPSSASVLSVLAQPDQGPQRSRGRRRRGRPPQNGNVVGSIPPLYAAGTNGLENLLGFLEPRELLFGILKLTGMHAAARAPMLHRES